MKKEKSKDPGEHFTLGDKKTFSVKDYEEFIDIITKQRHDDYHKAELFEEYDALKLLPGAMVKTTCRLLFDKESAVKNVSFFEASWGRVIPLNHERAVALNDSFLLNDKGTCLLFLGIADYKVSSISFPFPRWLVADKSIVVGWISISDFKIL